MATRRGLILFFCLLPTFSGGCLWLRPGEQEKLVKRMRLPLSTPEEDTITLDLAVIERPMEDPFLDHELWTSTDEMVVSFERKRVLNANGFRFGQVVGLTPSGLQTLLRSERYCLTRRRRVLPEGKTMTQVMGPVYSQAVFTVHEEESKAPHSLDQARFCLDIVPTRTKEGHIKLSFAPRVETGERMLPFQPDLERSTWTIVVDKPSRSFPGLNWDVTVEPNRFIVLGALSDRPETLGHATFTDREGGRVRRLLVIRASCPAQASPMGTDEDGLPPGAPLPLALQAAYPGK